MSKNIILCSDGTGNRGGVGRGTNVWRIYQALDLDIEEPLQFSFYDDGVGTEDSKFRKIIGGAFGYGMGKNIRELYTRLAKNYDPNDHLFLFGFSRGAFTVRSLIGLISLCGIVDRKICKDVKELDIKIKKAWKIYKRIHWHQKKLNRLRAENNKLEDDIKNFTYKLKSIENESEKKELELKHKKYKSKQDKNYIIINKILAPVNEFKDDYCVKFPINTDEKQDYKRKTNTDIPIDFVGVWDTVGAVGLPFDELTDAFDKIWPIKFHQHDLSSKVKAGYHALAIDDERHTFHPVLWDQNNQISTQQIEQVWFSGVHSNVGGGYPKDGMAHVTLNWMIEKAKYHGLIFNNDKLREYEQASNVHSKLYDSRSGLAAYYRYKPRDIGKLCKNAGIKTPVVHDTVIDRIKRSTQGYAPCNIPTTFDTTPSGSNSKSVLNITNKNSGVVKNIENGWKTYIEQARNYTWFRRGLYFLLLMSTYLFLVAAMSLAEEHSIGCDGGPLCFFVNIVLGIFRWILPAYFDNWINGLEANPDVTLVLIVIFILLSLVRSFFRNATNYFSLSAWKIAFPLGVIHLPEENMFHNTITSLRKSSLFTKLIPFIHRNILPWFIIVITAIVFLQVSGKLIFENRTIEKICLNNSPPNTGELLNGESRVIKFNVHDPCHVSDFEVVKGERYAFSVQVLGKWKDSTIPATPDGFDTGFTRIFSSMKIIFALPMRRSITERWFMLMGSIGKGAKHEFVIGKGLDEIKFHHTGRLNLFVNDAVCPLCWWDSWSFYKNNKPESIAALITVTHIQRISDIARNIDVEKTKIN